MPDAPTDRNPLLIDRASLDLSALRAHCRDHHRGPYPRANLDLATWHNRQHHRLHLSHIHRGPFVLILDADGRRPLMSHPRPLGRFTGQEMVTRAQLDADFRAAHRG